MESILSLIESGVTGLTLTLKSEDLKEFAHLLIEKAKEQLLPVMVSASHEALLTKKELLEKFNVCHTTLWNWERKGYLIPVKIGRKVSYRQADIERIIIERGKR
ncbi:MAG: helix-turn-helix domain-containing protein [Bacteroides sp.]|nr:helix-turn-helix domain-containing protein [Bacteroides sp.]